MSYYVKSTLGLAIFFASLAAFAYCLYHLIKTGSCGSSQTYVTYRPCPSGTGTLIVVLTLSVFTGLGGAGLYALKGDDPGPDGFGKRGIPLGLLALPLLFTTIGAVGLYTAFGPGQHTSKSFGIIFGGIFLLVGGIPLIGVLIYMARRGPSTDDSGGPSAPVPAPAAMPAQGMSPRGVPLPTPTQRPSAPPTPGAGPPPPKPQPFSPAPTTPAAAKKDDEEDPLDRIKKLAKLRDEGVLSESEFETAKRKLLEDVD